MTSFRIFQDFDFDILLMYCSGALFEVLGEPWFNIFQSAGIYAPRLKADTLAVFVRSVVTFISIAYFSMGIKGFGYAQMSYGLVHFLTMISSTSNVNFKINNLSCKMIDFLPKRINDDNNDDNNTTNNKSNEKYIEKAEEKIKLYQQQR